MPLAINAAPGVSYIFLATGILTVLSLLAAALAYTRSQYAKATIEVLKESNGALTERVRLLEEDSEHCQTKLALLENENNNLRTYVSGAEAVQVLAAQLKQQHTEQIVRLAEISEGFSAHLKMEHSRAVDPDGGPARR